MADFPPWLTPQYNPVETFMRAYQTGAQISEAQTRLAEQQRQASMEAQARQEQLQSTMLRAMTETAVQKAYQEEQIALRQQDLAQEKARYDALGQQAAATLAEQIAHNQMLEQFRAAEVSAPGEKLAAQQTFADEYKKSIESGMNAPEAYRNALLKSPTLITPTTAPALSGKNTQDERMRDFIARSEITRTAKQFDAATARANDPLFTENKTEWEKKADALKAKYTDLVGGYTNAPLSNLPPPVPPGPQVSQYKVGGIYRKGNQRLRYLGGEPTNESSWEEVK